MFSSGMRNISFQDLFARSPRPHSSQGGDAAVNAAIAFVRGGVLSSSDEEQSRGSEEVATAAVATVRAFAAPRDAPAPTRSTSSLPLATLPSDREKASLGFILGGVRSEAQQQQCGDAKLRQFLALPSQHQYSRHSDQQQSQFTYIKREPVERSSMQTYEESHDYHGCSDDPRHAIQRDTPVFAHGRVSICSSNGSSNDSSDMYERTSATREVVRLPPIASSASSSPLQQPYLNHCQYQPQRQQPQQQQQQQEYAQQFQFPADLSTLAADATSGKRKKKRKARICKEDGCDKYVVDHGLCIRHGGGKRCNVEDCNCRAQNRGLCWKHGGYTICKIDGCTKRAKSRGICWSHGGGTRCKSDGCSKIAVSLGRCWAHGGGKRCSIENCRKPASERTNNLCADHFVWYQRGQSGRDSGNV